MLRVSYATVHLITFYVSRAFFLYIYHHEMLFSLDQSLGVAALYTTSYFAYSSLFPFTEAAMRAAAKTLITLRDEWA